VSEKYLLRLGDEDDTTLEFEREDGTARVRREGGEWKNVELERIGDSGLYLLMVDDRPTELYLERRRGGAIVTLGRHAFNYDMARHRRASGILFPMRSEFPRAMRVRCSRRASTPEPWRPRRCRFPRQGRNSL